MSSGLLQAPVFRSFSTPAMHASSMTTVCPSPTVDFGHDFDLILRKCLHERKVYKRNVSVNAVITTTAHTGSCQDEFRADASSFSLKSTQEDSTIDTERPKMDDKCDAKQGIHTAQVMVERVKLLEYTEGDMDSDIYVTTAENEHTPTAVTETIDTLVEINGDDYIVFTKSEELFIEETGDIDECSASVRLKFSNTTTVVQYPDWRPAKKGKKKKQQGQNKKWKTVDDKDFELSFAYVKPCSRGCLGENNVEIEKELKKFEKLCEEEPQPSTSAQADTHELAISADTKKTSIDVKVINDAEEEEYYYGAIELCELEYKAMVGNVFSHKLVVHEDIIGLKFTRLRKKKKWESQKAHIQVKSKYCSSFKNGGHEKKLYINSRVVKRMSVMIDKVRYNYNNLSMRRIDKQKGIKAGVKLKEIINNPSSSAVHQRAGSRGGGLAKRPDRNDPPPPAYALSAYNADGDLEAEMVNIMMAAQHRDLTPEDYELLLRLDERVAARTVAKNVLDSLPVEVATGTEGVCAVCLEDYTAGQKRKILPCGHDFHGDCIDNWLNNSSMNCPLDGLEVSV